MERENLDENGCSISFWILNESNMRILVFLVSQKEMHVQL